MAELDGLRHAVAVVGVHHQLDVRADRPAHGLGVPEILLEAEADLELDGRKALGGVALGLLGQIGLGPALRAAVEARRVGSDALAQGPAHQPMDRLAQQLALEIPERDVDARERLDDEAALAVVAELVVEPLPERLGRHRIPAQQQRAHRRHHRGIRPLPARSTRRSRPGPRRSTISTISAVRRSVPEKDQEKGRASGASSTCVTTSLIFIRHSSPRLTGAEHAAPGAG